ncbi:MAG: hypothetical protein O7C61_03175 [SAR324 cluster bacterium]|nr:hypothetical protein [SAR324 cluster bacterium]
MVSIRTILWGVNSLLLMGLAYSLSVTTAHVLERELTANTPPPVERKRGDNGLRASTKMTFSEFNSILETNMFRAKRSAPLVVKTAAAPTTTTAPASVPDAAPASQKLPIRLKLTGTMIMKRGSVAFVVGPDGRSEHIYRRNECVPLLEKAPPGDCTPNQAKLVRIHRDRIILTMNKRRYTVSMGESERTPPNASRTAAIPNKGRSRRVTAKASIGSRNSARRNTVYPTTQEGNTIEMRLPSADVEKAFENFSVLLNQARVVPYIVDGTPQGFQIRRIVPGSIFARLGLRNSDVIKSVNGDSLTTADQALRMFTLFRNESEIALEIERGKKPLRLNYIIE